MTNKKICKECGKTFKSEKLIEIHMETHKYSTTQTFVYEKVPSCLECPYLKKLSGPKLKIDHMESPKYYEKKDGRASQVIFLSDETDNSFRVRITKLPKKTETSYKCSDCNSKFTYKKTLDKHLTNNQRYKFICDICNRNCCYKSRLIRHMKIHFKA